MPAKASTARWPARSRRRNRQYKRCWSSMRFRRRPQRRRRGISKPSVSTLGSRLQSDAESRQGRHLTQQGRSQLRREIGQSHLPSLPGLGFKRTRYPALNAGLRCVVPSGRLQRPAIAAELPLCRFRLRFTSPAPPTLSSDPDNRLSIPACGSSDTPAGFPARTAHSERGICPEPPACSSLR